MYLRALAFEEAEHIKIAVALGELRPEFADNFDHRLDARVIDLNFLNAQARLPHLGDKLRAVEMIDDLARDVEKACEPRGVPQRRGQPARRAFQNLELPPGFQEKAQPVHYIINRPVSAARNGLEGTDAVAEVVDHVAQVEHVERAKIEVQRELQSGIIGCGLDGLLGLVKHNAESLIACVLERQTILRLVHAEAAGSA